MLSAGTPQNPSFESDAACSAKVSATDVVYLYQANRDEASTLRSPGGRWRSSWMGVSGTVVLNTSYHRKPMRLGGARKSRRTSDVMRRRPTSWQRPAGASSGYGSTCQPMTRLKSSALSWTGQGVQTSRGDPTLGACRRWPRLRDVFPLGRPTPSRLIQLGSLQTAGIKGFGRYRLARTGTTDAGAPRFDPPVKPPK